MTSQADRVDILRAAGFPVLGERDDAAGVTPEQAATPLISATATPRVRVDLDAADTDTADAATERAWRKTADEVGLFGDDGVFCVCVTGPGAFRLPWVVVRAPEGTGFLATLRQRCGSPDFVAVAQDGSTAVGVFEEEDENWIVTGRPEGARP
ncbi:hypothetical protein B1813_19440 [Saccharomonospora piscinae]|uniref:Uncharacterized protein n=1 Tax=Saccharomonospora piscinae TaxID=687388 RepID=A0A1V8ZZ95_SACPI|nr:hypothetical protein [Saccharomonospora piscinae]OQO90004.1 hypothetical protein B1813_19440 [Saccharomonospora piscinae]